MFLTRMHLPRRTFLRSLGATIALPLLDYTIPARTALAQTAATPNWHVTATVAESCSCDISCPCNFGSNPTRMPCDGNRLISIQSGQYEDLDLSGVALFITFTLRGWSKIYVSDRATARQMTAVEALLPIAFAGFHRGMLSFTKAPITMEFTEKRVAFSGPESSVDMEVMRGNDGKPVKVSICRTRRTRTIRSTVQSCCGTRVPTTDSATPAPMVSLRRWTWGAKPSGPC